MAFPPSFLDEIRERVPLASVIGRTVRLVRKGREQVGLCPFHNEKSPSFTVNEDKGFFHCFGCGAHGDVIAFLMQAQRLSFVDAVEHLAAEGGLTMPEQAPEDRAQARHLASLYDVLEAATAFFEASLRGPAGRAGLAYLHGRGLDDETISRFRLGYAPDSRVALKQALKALPEALLIEAGLLIEPDGGGDSYDRFRGRVMFPIGDRRGRVIAFGGRVLADGQPKYLNSPDTTLFHKGSVVYGLAQAREPAARSGTIIVCEGYMDVIALHRAGYTHAVAPLGTALTERQLALLWTMVPEPILCFDGDAAGQRAAERAALRALGVLTPGRSLRFAELPGQDDPDSLIRTHGREAMTDILSRAIPMADLLWRTKFAGLPLATPEQRQGAELEIRRFFEVIPDQGLRRDYAFEFVARLRAAAREARAAAMSGRTMGGRPTGGWAGGRGVPGRARGPRARSFAPRDPAGHVVVSLRPSSLPPPAWRTQERLLMALVIHHPALLDDVEEKLGELAFADLDLDNLRQEVLKHAGTWRSLDFEAARTHLYACGFTQNLDCLLEASVHDQTACFKPGAPLETARKAWSHLYALYKQREFSADMHMALQRAAVELNEETFAYYDALSTSAPMLDGIDGEGE